MRVISTQIIPNKKKMKKSLVRRYNETVDFVLFIKKKQTNEYLKHKKC